MGARKKAPKKQPKPNNIYHIVYVQDNMSLIYSCHSKSDLKRMLALIATDNEKDPSASWVDYVFEGKLIQKGN